MNTHKPMALRTLMEQALQLRKARRPHEAAGLLENHAAAVARDPAGCGLLATLYWEVDDYEHARDWFARACALSPRSEKGSLGLFHSLWNLGKREEAFDEMRRYLRLADSKEYARLLKELNRELAAPAVNAAGARTNGHVKAHGRNGRAGRHGTRGGFARKKETAAG